MLQDWRQKRQTTSQRPRVDVWEDHQAPETYLALAGGTIPALAGGSETSGTGTGTGTGGDEPPQPGVLECAIYKRVDQWGVPEIIPAGFTREIHNVSSSVIPAGSWMLVWRDKFGTWFGMPADSSGGAAINSSCRVNTLGIGTQTVHNSELGEAGFQIEFAPPSTSYDPYSWDNDGYFVRGMGTGSEDNYLRLPRDGEYLVTFQLAFNISGLSGANFVVAGNVVFDPDESPFSADAVCGDYWQRVSVIRDPTAGVGGTGSFKGKAGKHVYVTASSNGSSGHAFVLEDSQCYFHIKYLGPL